MDSNVSALQLIQLNKDAALFGVTAGRAHREALDEVFRWRSNISENANRERQQTGLMRVRQFIEKGTPILEDNDPALRSREPLRPISPAAAFLTLIWPSHFHVEVRGLMKRYIDAGYMTLGPTKVVTSWGNDVQVVSKAGSLIEAALIHSSAWTVNAILRLGATLDNVPAQTQEFDNGTSSKTIEAGDAVALVDHFFSADGVAYEQLRAAAQAARMRRMASAIAQVTGVDDLVEETSALGAALAGVPGQVELGGRELTGVGDWALISRGRAPGVARRRGL